MCEREGDRLYGRARTRNYEDLEDREAPTPTGSDTDRRSGAIGRIATIPSTTKTALIFPIVLRAARLADSR